MFHGFRQHCADFLSEMLFEIKSSRICFFTCILFKAENESGSAKAQAKKEAQRVLAKIKRGTDFAEMARIYGTDGTAARGGDLGWFGENSDFDQKSLMQCTIYSIIAL